MRSDTANIIIITKTIVCFLLMFCCQSKHASLRKLYTKFTNLSNQQICVGHFTFDISANVVIFTAQMSDFHAEITVSSNPKPDKLKLIIFIYGPSFHINRNVPFVLMKISLGKSNSEQTSFEVHINFAQINYATNRNVASFSAFWRRHLVRLERKKCSCQFFFSSYSTCPFIPATCENATIL